MNNIIRGIYFCDSWFVVESFIQKYATQTSFTFLDGSCVFWSNGLFHREDGPAITWSDGRRYWYINGELHREDGPAIDYGDGNMVWFLDGERLTEAEFIKRMKDFRSGM